MVFETLVSSELEETAHMQGLLNNRVLLITGATGGLGSAVVRAAAKQGAQLVLLAKREAALDQLYDAVIDLGAPEPLMIPLDLSKLDEVSAFEVVDGVSQHFGGLHALFHAAGILGKLGPLEQYAPNLWHEVLSVNLNSAFMLTQQALDLMKSGADASASVVFLDATAEFGSGAYWGAYAAAAAGVRALAESWAGELGNTTQVRVNLVNPGPLRTPLRAEAFPAEDPGVLRDPSELAHQFVYLLSERSRAINAKRIDLSA